MNPAGRRIVLLGPHHASLAFALDEARKHALIDVIVIQSHNTIGKIAKVFGRMTRWWGDTE